MRMLTAFDLITKDFTKERERELGTLCWRFDEVLLTLTSEVPPAPYEYEIDLEELRSSAQVLDVICQIAEKTWATSRIVGDLVRALNLLLEPQANLCSWGQSKKVADVGAVIRKVRQGWKGMGRARRG
jgi:hypothetical protein